MTRSAAIVLVLLILGDLLVERFSLPIPGAALGLLALSAVFAIRRGPDKGSEQLFDFAAPYFPLFFVPAAVGVVASMEILSNSWIHVVFAIVVGTTATLLITGGVLQAFLARTECGARS